MKYKSTQEIKETFSIDIRDRNQSIIYVALRAFYSKMRAEELKDIPKAYTIIANEINCNRPNLYNLILKAKLFKEDSNTKILFEAFENKDKSLIKKYKDLVSKQKKEYNRNLYLQKQFKDYKEPIAKVQVITQFDKNKALMSNLKLAEFLRKNKELKHDVWNIPVKNISDNQWQEVRNINKIMFDNYAN